MKGALSTLIGNMIVKAFFLIAVLLAFEVKGQSKNLKVYVDERIELLTTVQYLSGYFLLTNANLDYKREIDSYFAKHKNHPVVELFKEISPEYFAFDGPIIYILYHSLPDLRPISDFPKSTEVRYGFDVHKDTLDLFRQQLKDFYKVTKFSSFFAHHQQFYELLSKPLINKINEQDIIKEIEGHYGVKNKKYNIVLSPLLHDGGFGPSIRTKREEEFYAIIGPKSSSDGTPIYDLPNIIQKYVLHEFSHSFCNPVIDKNYNQFEKYECLLKPILESQRKQGYGNWKVCLYEHLVRANEVILCKKLFGDKAAGEIRDDYVLKRNWIYLDGIISILESSYLKDRSTYRTMEDIIPLLERFLGNESKNCL